MKQIVYLVVGVPASGKSWVCNQLKHKFLYLAHDLYIEAGRQAYIDDIEDLAFASIKPILVETPFSVSQFTEPLAKAGITVKPFFIIEELDIIAKRYEERGNGPMPEANITRLSTYYKRANELGAFKGTSKQVLEALKNL